MKNYYYQAKFENTIGILGYQIEDISQNFSPTQDLKFLLSHMLHTFVKTNNP